MSRLLHWPLRGVALLLATAALLVPPMSAAQSAPGGVTVSWPSATMVRGSAQTVTGTVADIGTVALEQKVLGGWRTVVTTSSTTTGDFAITLPTWWLGSRTYRVRSATATTPDWQVRVTPRYAPRGKDSQFHYSFASMTRWNPCTTIGYRVNARHATRGAVKDTKRAFHRMAQATGFTFAYRGTTRGVPSSGTNDWYPRDTQVVVAWAKPSQSSLLSSYPKAAGVGAAMARTGYFNGDGSSTNLISRGMVVINSTMKQRAGFGNGLTRGDTLLHEIGHAMGLSHAGADEQMMYAYLTRSAARFGRGDLHALEARGSKLGCVATSGPRVAARAATPRVAAIRVAP
jgi:hypothetical protein